MFLCCQGNTIIYIVVYDNIYSITNILITKLLTLSRELIYPDKSH